MISNIRHMLIDLGLDPKSVESEAGDRRRGDEKDGIVARVCRRLTICEWHANIMLVRF